MKNLMIIFSLLIVSLSYGTNTLDCKESNRTIDLCKNIESNFIYNKILNCEYETTTTTTTNSDGSSTSTTTTTVSCDTPQELAVFNAIGIQIVTQK